MKHNKSHKISKFQKSRKIRKTKKYAGNNITMQQRIKTLESLNPFKKREPTISSLQQVDSLSTEDILTKNSDNTEEYVGTASAIGAFSIISKTVIVGLTGVGLVTPAGPAIAIALIVVHKLAEYYKYNTILRQLLRDIMLILTECYRLNKLSDKINDVLFIYVYNNKIFDETILRKYDDNIKKQMVKYMSNFINEGVNVISNEEVEKKLDEPSLENNNTDLSTLLVRAKQNLVNKLKEIKGKTEEDQIFAPDDVLDKNNIDKNDKNILIGKITKDKAVEKRLYSKIKFLTVYLLDITPNEIISSIIKTFDTDTNLKNSDFGKLLTEVYEKRQSKTDFLMRGRRAFMRTVKSKMVIDRLIQELSVINGFYNLINNQNNLLMEYYSRELIPSEYKKIWKFIESLDEYKDFMISKESADEIFKKETKNIKNVTGVDEVAKVIENDTQPSDENL